MWEASSITEGIIPALESSHAFASVIEEASHIPDGSQVLINLSGRGDKDIFNIAEAIGDKKWEEFLRQKASSNQWKQQLESESGI